MRCKVGDLAVVVGPGVYTPGLLGRYVIVKEFIGVRHGIDLPGEPAWMCEPAVSGGTLPVITGVVPGPCGLEIYVEEVPSRAISDCVLRPIRPDDGEDESLSWSRPRVEEHA